MSLETRITAVIQRIASELNLVRSEIGSGGGGGTPSLSGEATVTVPTGWDCEQTIAAVGVTPSMRVFAALAPTTDADENDPSMLDLLTLWARPGVGQITFGLTFSEITSGPIKLIWTAQ